MKKIKVLILILSSKILLSQVGIGIPSPEATLDIRAADPANPTSKDGLGLPIVNVLPSSGNVAGQMIYLSSNKNIYYYDGTKWLSIIPDTKTNVGKVKYGFQGSDHNGWFLCDGRSIGSLGLNATQISNAASLGLTNLPNAINRVLKMNGTPNIAFFTDNNITLTQANLPNYVMTGVTTTDNNPHSHSGIVDIRANPPSGLETQNGGQGRYWNETSHTETTDSGGSHTHTLPDFNNGGLSGSISVEDAFLRVNVFVYLGE